MKGRLLTVEEVNNLKDGQVVWMEPCDNDFKNEIGRGVVEKSESEIRVRFEKNDTWLLSSKHSAYSELYMNIQIKLYEYIEVPKTYKTSEMIAMLEENPKLKFKINNVFTCYVKDDHIIIEDNSSYRKFDFLTTDRWTLIEEPKEVTFMDALDRHQNGEDIYFEIGKNGKLKIKPKELHMFSLSEIATAKWFVEE